MDRLQDMIRWLLIQALLRMALANIRLMQWLFKHQFIARETTDVFFRLSKTLERRADGIVAADRHR